MSAECLLLKFNGHLNFWTTRQWFIPLLRHKRENKGILEFKLPLVKLDIIGGCSYSNNCTESELTHVWNSVLEAHNWHVSIRSLSAFSFEPRHLATSCLQTTRQPRQVPPSKLAIDESVSYNVDSCSSISIRSSPSNTHMQVEPSDLMVTDGYPATEINPMNKSKNYQPYPTVHWYEMVFVGLSMGRKIIHSCALKLKKKFFIKKQSLSLH